MVLELVLKKVAEFVELDFESEEVKVEVHSKGVSLLTLDGQMELARGAEYVLPRWVADFLSKRGVAKLKEERPLIEALSGIAYTEETSQSKVFLNKLKGFFYKRVNRAKASILEEAKRGPDLSKLEEYKKIENMMDTITKVRLRKIINMALVPELQHELVDKLSDEERILLRMLSGVLDVWLRHVVK